MSYLTMLLIAISLAMDAFAVSISNGVKINNNVSKYAFTYGIFFGIFQFGMTIIGYYTGNLFSDFVSSYANIIAAAILFIVGSKMFIEGLKKKEETSEDDDRDPTSYKTLTLLAIATSIDALAVGVSFSVTNVEILMPSVIIGTVAFIFSTCGVFIGNKIKRVLGNGAELLGGAVLIIISLITFFS